MAKGLILCHQNEIFAGESAGFGLPVLKTGSQTIFPSLSPSAWRQHQGEIEAVYHLNLTLSWQILGIPAPLYFPVFMEKIVDFYMDRPQFQSAGLNIRNALFKLFRVRSTMTPGKSFGYCRVNYQASTFQLAVSINATAMQRGRLILLNEVPGTGFSRMKTGRKTLDGPDFLPWQECGFDTAIENPGLHIGFFLSVPDNQSRADFQVAAGREVARDLNWAGLSLATDQRKFTYMVKFYHPGT